jgi:alkylation response protein AidB-like acyl-CoA dehydrogenase
MGRLNELRDISAEDRRLIEQAEEIMGPEPSEMGFIKNLFWGRFKEETVLPYPEQNEEEANRCEILLNRLDAYLEEEHPSVLIDREQRIPDWVIERLFALGVMGMTVPEEYGGLGFGITSYNRVLERIGRTCGATAVMVSAHQSIGCKAIMLFGTEEQKERWLPRVATEWLSAFCLSEPRVGSDASAQETYCRRSPDGSHYILNGEKKWSTSGALSGLFTVLAKQEIVDPETGQTKDQGVTALICTPEMDGVDIFEKNRSKCGIRGTWQARIRFDNVKVPVENRLHEEGKALKVALTCLDYGRCTLSAGVMGAAKQASEQAVKWTQTRYQFGRPLADFELVQQRTAEMSAITYAMDAMLYLVTDLLDREAPDIMVETAAAKVFCSSYGWKVIDHAMQVMGGEGYMTENELERIWRDNRIHRIVEGSNDVMRSFIFGYGGKQLAEQLLGLRDMFAWKADEKMSSNLRRLSRHAGQPVLLKRAVGVGAELFVGVKPSAPSPPAVDPALESYADRIADLVQQHSHLFKKVSYEEEEAIMRHQTQQGRIADNAILLFAMAAVLSKMDSQICIEDPPVAVEKDLAAGRYFLDWARQRFIENTRTLENNADDVMRDAAGAMQRYMEEQPNEEYYIPDSSPVAAGPGNQRPRAGIRHFPGDRLNFAANGYRSRSDSDAKSGGSVQSSR